MPFSLSYFGLTTKDLNWLRQAASKYIFKRKWIEAEILPYILQYVGITTLLDPALSAVVAALGLYLREGNHARCSNSRQRAVVQDLLNMWHPYVLFEDIFSALITGAGTPAQTIANLKKGIITGMVRETRKRLAIKIDREGWQGGIDQVWVELVAGAPKRQCGGVGVALYSRHIPANKEMIGYGNGGKLCQLLTWYAELVDVVITQLGTGHVGALFL